jgi:dihydrofolate reductase
VLSVICAVARNGVIGSRGGLPWHLPDDLAHFKRTTLGKPVIMGRRTHDSIGRPLPGRRNLVVTRDRRYRAPGCEVVHSLDEALERCADAPEAVVIGGASLYAEALERAQRLYLTQVHAEPPGDAFFPPCDLGDWREVARVDHRADARHAHAFSILTLERRSGPRDP